MTGIDENGSPIYETIADGDTENNTVPAGTAVVLSYKQAESSTEPTEPTPTMAALEYGGEDNRDFSNNLLKGSDEPTTTTGGETYYKLSGGENGQDGGWTWGAENGDAFESGEHQAWLVLPTKTTDETPLDLPEKDPESNCVQSIEVTTLTDGWYTINGVKLEGEPTTKGIYIWNGRKVVVQ